MKLLSLLILTLLLIPFTYSLDIYIDEEITIDNKGDAEIIGSTNLDFLKDIKPINEKIEGSTPELTTKEGKYWIFSYNSKENVSASFIKVSLPKGAVINHIKSGLLVNIATGNDVITATFFGEDKVADIQIQYSMSDKEFLEISALPWLVILSLIALATITMVFLSNKKKLSINTMKLSEIKTTLNETQIKIIDALLEKKGQSSQTAIQYMSGIPKASLSRNVELLAQKEIIQKFYNGTSNHIKIHPKFKK